MRILKITMKYLEFLLLVTYCFLIHVLIISYSLTNNVLLAQLWTINQYRCTRNLHFALKKHS